MLKVLLPQGSPGACRQRLERVGLRFEDVDSGAFPSLDADSLERVVLVPAEVFQGSGWARLRVQLAQATRFFVVELDGAATTSVVAAMRDGAFDVIAREDSDSRWRTAIESAASNQRIWHELYAGRLDEEGDRLVGRSDAMRELRRDLERLGPTDVTVLLMGESGVGKERVSAALHAAGRGGPLVTLNCAAMPRELVEAELFGAEKGSFTGAVRSRPGLVEQANGGTLFLDEVGELDLAVQPKLLRFLETRRARRVGGECEYSVRVRVVAATNRNLEREVTEGRFRADLFYRLAEVVIRIPPLRARVDDIPDLARVFVAAANERFGKNVETIEPELLLRLRQHSWPGNIRELKGVIDRLVLFHDGPVLRSGWWDPPPALGSSSAVLPGGLGAHAQRASAPGGAPAPELSPTSEERATANSVESMASLPGKAARLELARRLLEEGNLSLGEVAARVGIHPTTLFRWRRAGKAGAALPVSDR